MNNIKGFTVGYSVTDNKMMFEYGGKRYVAEFREIVNPSEDMVDDMRRIKYL
jgi:hypothetical protein